ncbi:MAG: hypothetical protein KJO98_13230 [Rhodothermia bacterium]|nr:hypothetical protein [Rhodothermia bacterium]
MATNGEKNVYDLLRDLAEDESKRAQFAEDPESVMSAYEIGDEAREAILNSHSERNHDSFLEHLRNELSEIKVWC